MLISSTPSSPCTTNTWWLPSRCNTCASGSSHCAWKTPTTWLGASAGLVSGPSRLTTVRTPISRRGPMACFIAPWSSGASMKPTPTSCTQRAACAAAAISSTVPPVMRRPRRKPPICADVAPPGMMVRITSVISSERRSRRSVTARMAAGMSIEVSCRSATRRQKILEHGVSVLREYRLRVKLHAFQRVFAVAHTHDLITLAALVLRPRGHLETGGQGRLFDDQRVIARRLERIRQPFEHAFIGMMDRRGLAVHHLPRAHHLAAEGLTDGLVTEPHAEQRNFPRKLADDLERYARLVGCARARRNDDVIGLEPCDRVDTNLIVAIHAHVFAELGQVLHEVVGEGVVIIDHERHKPTHLE